jgi:hypothetical protein
METGWSGLNRFTRWKPSKDIQSSLWTARRPTGSRTRAARMDRRVRGSLGIGMGPSIHLRSERLRAASERAVEQAAVDTGDGHASEFVRKAAEEYREPLCPCFEGTGRRARNLPGRRRGPSSPNPAAGADRLLTSAELLPPLPLVNGGERLELLGFLSLQHGQSEVCRNSPRSSVGAWRARMSTGPQLVLEKMGSFLAQHPNAPEVTSAKPSSEDATARTIRPRSVASAPKRNELTLLSRSSSEAARRHGADQRVGIGAPRGAERRAS